MNKDSLSPTQQTPAGLANAPLVDRYGRRVTYLRLSITDRCDFRCNYCMGEDITFLPRHQIMSLEECIRVVQVFMELGVTKLRITGGEPLVRPNAMWLLEQLGKMEGLKELVLTTNGSQLARRAQELKAAGVKRLNISLDTLNPDLFHTITRTGQLNKVLQGIQAAQEAGFQHTKLNTVLMRGINDQELPAMVQFALDHQLDISFIEEMPLGDINGRADTYLSAQEALAGLQQHFNLISTEESSGGPARYWRIPGSQTRVGFISPHSHNFCESCNRVRITAQGELYPCLGHNDAAALLPLMRDNPDDNTLLRQTIMDTMGIKPLAHDFTHQIDNPQVVRFMSMTGG